MNQLRITVFTCFHLRHDISRLFIERTQSLGLKLFAVTSTEDPESAEMCREYGVDYVIHKNSPLGAKWNKGIEHALFQSDYVVIMGSDDLMTQSYLDAVIPKMAEGVPFGGIDSIYMVEHGNESKAAVLKYKGVKKMLGCGCFISSKALRSVATRVKVRYTGSIDKGFVKTPTLQIALARHLEATGKCVIASTPFYELWQPEQNKGLDNTRDLQMALMGYEPLVIETPTPTIVAVKSGTNIWSYDKVMRFWAEPCEYELVKPLL